MSQLLTKTLGRSTIKVSAIGMGCWAIGGVCRNEKGIDCGWGTVDDTESIRAIKHAIALGVNFFETSDVYGAGHSESILGQALAGNRENVVLATKFGYVFDPKSKQYTHENVSPQYIRQACEASLKRLNTDYIDLYQLHVGSLAPESAYSVAETLEKLQKDGLIRAYGWSTDDVQLAEIFAQKPNCASVEYKLNIFSDNKEMVAMCERQHLASIIRGPLSKGLLTGKFTVDSVLPANDVRGANNTSGFENGKPNPKLLSKLESIREILTSKGRTLTQGALAWVWGRTQSAIPIPGFKTVQQVAENAKALQFGPLTQSQLSEIENILSQN